MDTTKQRIGEINHFWKNGRSVTKDGYIEVICYGRKNKHKYGNYVLEHRLVMERHLGRELLSQEIVHHINGIKTDNNINNLKLVTYKTHRGEHRIDNWSKKHDKCLGCGRNDRKHASRGYCTACDMRKRSYVKWGEPNRDITGKIIRSEEYRRKMSKSMMGNKNGIDNLVQYKKCCGR